jgi:undecaprenyl-diphosphatase
MDIFLFRLINDIVGIYPVLDRLAVYTTRYLIYTLPLFAAVIFYFVLAKGTFDSTVKGALCQRCRPVFFELVKAGFSAVLAYAINFLISTIHFRLRPIFTLDDVHQLMTKPITDKSFPSDHTAVSFAIAFFVFLVSRKWGSVMLVLAFLIGISRIYVGVHFPSDVFAGAVVGIISATIVRMSDRVRRSFNKGG